MSGIFEGNVLGSRGATGFGALGADPQIPWWCWDKPTFKEAHGKCWRASDPDARAFCVESLIDAVCPWNDPPKGTGKGTRAASFAPGDACSSSKTIGYVQAVIGTDVDGKWGPKSAAALKKYGKSFKQIAEGCTGPAPSYSSGASVTTTTPATVDPAEVAAEKQSGFSDLFGKVPTIAWVGVAGIAGLLLLRSMSKKGSR